MTTETPEAVVARHMKAELAAQRGQIDCLTDAQRLRALVHLVWAEVPADVRASALEAVTR